MVYEEIITILGALGVSGLLGASITYILDKRKQIKLQLEFSLQKYKKERYGSMIIQMQVIVKPEDLKYVKKFRPDFEKVDDYKNDIHAEWLHSLSYASDDVIKSLKEFLLKPDSVTYAKTVIAMRKDLWNKNTDLKPEEINL